MSEAELKLWKQFDEKLKALAPKIVGKPSIGKRIKKIGNAKKE